MSLARSEAEVETLRERVADQRQHGLFCDWLEADEAREQHPWLPEIQGALLAPEDGAVNPARVVEALIADGARLGVRRVDDRITALEPRTDACIGARGKEKYSAGTVRARRGRVVGTRGRPSPSGLGRTGAGTDGGVRSSRDDGGRDRLLRRSLPAHARERGHRGEHDGARRVHGARIRRKRSRSSRRPPARSAACSRALKPSRTWVGLRPGTPDGLPIIGREPRCRRALVCDGARTERRAARGNHRRRPGADDGRRGDAGECGGVSAGEVLGLVGARAEGAPLRFTARSPPRGGR